jgi:hypothetical protein
MDQAQGIPTVVWKIIVTSAVGALAYFITNVTDQPEIWRLTVSVFIGGATLIVQYLTDFERRLETVEKAFEQHTTAMREVVENGFEQINEATRFFGLVERSPVPTRAVTELVHHVTQLETGSQDIIHSFAEAEISRLAVLLKDLKADQVEYEGEDHDWIVTLTHCATATIDATSTSVDSGLWTSELGRRYLAAQRAAIDRGVHVRRLFIVDRPEQIDDDIKELRRSHEVLGVEARVVAISAVPLPVRLDPTNDFIVFDHAVSYEVSPDLVSSDQPLIASTRLVLRGERVARRTRRFNDLWAVGT